ncbi:hypothetical protein VHEMI10162 [[Torrubiella] hemipterigena]|uniref:Uncharacterized protein n=1 Tax=[Torrubiella] hemipterigena TaxID=1531966 RepID=A0A0A1TRP7_9HYPO|nr:hypothetical protein VHEMI10162 [[Torrubiella] hemipterigena]
MQCLLKDNDSSAESDLTMEPCRLLRIEGFTCFRAMSSEQQSLLKTGGFAIRLCAIMERLSNVRWLHFTDQAPEWWDTEPLVPIEEATMLTEDTKLLRVLAYPLHWGGQATYSYEDEDEELVFCHDVADSSAATLLSDIPIALARAGVEIRGLKISCFPVSQDMPLPIPARGALAGTDEELRLAFSSLERLEVRPRRAEDGRAKEFFSRQDYSILQSYLACCQSNPKLSNIEISLPNPFKLQNLQ